ncbi:MAG: DivIVA domain-containing protein [Clostridia bacterium]|nr:DivIVA domain-containing protein [Clostridia bacterium]
MKFKKVFSGYSPKQVDEYLRDLTQKHEQVRLAQKQHLDELTEENYQLRQKVKQFEQDEQAISKSLIESQKLASELKNDAVRFSELVLSRAKVFYATWQAYAKTLVATLDDQELLQFGRLMAKIERLINAYEGKNVHSDVKTIVDKARQTDVVETPTDQPQEDADDAQTEVAATDTPPVETPDLAPSATTMGVYANPIDKVEQAGQVIDLRELTKVDDSLEQLCVDLGLITPQEGE